MKDLTKIHYLKKGTRKNIPFDGDFRILFINGIGSSIRQKIGWYDENLSKWYLKDGQTEVHPFGWAYLIKWIPENNLQVKD